MTLNPDTPQGNRPTVGSLFAGIGGFDLGFEHAGFTTRWQVEIDPLCRAVLADRFPHAQQLVDVREVGTHNLEPVDVLVGGFPCQDLSSMGKQRGLAGNRSGLFFEVCRLLRELQPRWVVLENVTGLLACNDSQDFQTVVQSLAECGYVGLWRVLDARYFGVPQARRRVFLVGGLGRQPPMELLADAAAVAAVPGPSRSQSIPCEADRWPANTLLASNTPSRIALGCEVLVAHAGLRDSMVERGRAAADHGLCLGLDAANFTEARAAGNAVVPQVAQWIAGHLMRAIQT
ncbi:DNA cytosine methyltransferase [Parachitinimonas caeni]|uniref:Cytosine-specific methyltransferase n=1 Tax=Parachitinimonas caeni TaxID=3031301 RepID=A0ABT7DWQ0_9NEIS|nr:DNA (cytosine-5-)-methyltransferase [Parachitinimonas caeni]MDK2124504.1 DNA (cytosine-5-)-methyltransferase [Parachitinimonas caeni]